VESEESDKNIKKKSEHLQLLIEKYKKALNDVRQDCNHASSKLKLVKEDGSTGYFRWVCDACGKITGYPSKTDLENLK
jgi:hypothetical protein